MFNIKTKIANKKLPLQQITCLFLLFISSKTRMFVSEHPVSTYFTKLMPNKIVIFAKTQINESFFFTR
ncbi:hypothetical protein DIT68_09260 [Brumimicrobium oceani]|uniref:Uncharacterized protein n=1 Tax=Brumimicrobium oceani TaxID=2100725 RepID=A0A2U2XCB2_9FLAO|nr:hypothetical protein DIT68_09260 [Brumimicrobium oceani]